MGMKSMYNESRRNVWGIPVAMMNSSVAKWSRARVNVAVGHRVQEGRVDDVSHTGRAGSVDERPMLVDAVDTLGGRDHEEGLNAGQCLDRAVAVGV